MANNIRQLRKERGLTMEQLAALLPDNPHFTTIAKLERSQRTLSQHWIEQIAAALKVSPSAIISGEAQGVRMVPLLGSIPTGPWQEAVNDPIGHVFAPVGSLSAFALRPQGDSMNKVIMSGATVIIDPDQVELVDGKIYAVRNGSGDATLKMYRSTPPRLEPCSDNPKHQPIPVGAEPFIVIGRMVWQGLEM